MDITNINGIPESIESFLETRYRSSYNTRKYFELFKNYGNLNTALLKRNDVLEEAFIYELNSGKCTVLNRVIDIPKNNLDDFTYYIFKNNPNINEIVFTEFYSPYKTRYSINHVRLTDVCIELPDNVEEYTKRMGKKTLKTFRNSINRINKIENVEIVINECVTEENAHLIEDFIELKERRFKNIKRKNSFKGNTAKRNKEYALKYGRISYIKHNGILIGGHLCYKIIDQYYGIVIAFDVDYAWYSIGRILLYKAILSAIEENCTKYHFLWGGAEYKEHYAGEEIPLYAIHVFRSGNIHYRKKKLNILIKTKILKLKRSKTGNKLKKLYYKIIKK